jgi:HAD superfamily hydrolase (TIGR01509 family)
MLKAVIFDLDGTLVDSNELHVASWERAFRHYGRRFSIEQLRAQIGKGSDQYLPEFLSAEERKRFGKELDDYRSELFAKEYLPRVQPFPKVRELFERIRADGKKIVLATSSKKMESQRYKKLLAIEDLIDGETTADDTKHSKPEPDVFEAALQKASGVSNLEAIVVGDTRFDVEAAEKAGLKTIGFLCGGKSAEELRGAGAIAIYRDPADLLENYGCSPLNAPMP